MTVEIKNRWTGDVMLSVEGDTLRNADLSNADLSNADLRYADLRYADLSGADLSGAILSGADLSGAILSSADLSGADLSGTNLSDTNLSDTNLSGANLRDAILRDTNLSGANLLCAGNMREIRTMQFDRWVIGYTSDILQIGCQRHTIEKWRKWSTPAGQKWITAMDEDAAEWADRNLALVLSIIDANPAVATDKGVSA